jgi:hypothetical protein
MPKPSVGKTGQSLMEYQTQDGSRLVSAFVTNSFLKRYSSQAGGTFFALPFHHELRMSALRRIE